MKRLRHPKNRWHRPREKWKYFLQHPQQQKKGKIKEVGNIFFRHPNQRNVREQQEGSKIMWKRNMVYHPDM